METWAEQVVAQVAAIQGENWDDRLDALMREASTRLAVGSLWEGDYQTIAEAIHGRRARTFVSRERHVARRTELALVVGGVVASVAPTFPRPEPVGTPAQNQRRRGPARHTSDERRARIGHRRVEGGKAKLPAALRAPYTQGGLSVVSVVLFEISQNGSCALSVDAISKRAKVSERLVQVALSEARTLGHLSVRRRKRQTSIITTMHPQILERMCGYALVSKEKFLEFQEDIRSPFQGADSSSSNEVTEAEDAPAPIATAEAPAKLRKPAGAAPRTAPVPSFDALMARLDADVAASALKRRSPPDEDGSLAPSPGLLPLGDDRPPPLGVLRHPGRARRTTPLSRRRR